MYQNREWKLRERKEKIGQKGRMVRQIGGKPYNGGRGKGLEGEIKGGKKGYFKKKSTTICPNTITKSSKMADPGSKAEYCVALDLEATCSKLWLLLRNTWKKQFCRYSVECNSTERTNLYPSLLSVPASIYYIQNRWEKQLWNAIIMTGKMQFPF